MSTSARRDAEGDALRREIEARQGPQPTRTQLLSRRPFRSGSRVPGAGVWRNASGEAATFDSAETFPPLSGGGETEWTYVPPDSSR